MKNKGQALVEFIIVLPILIIIMLGIMDFCMIFSKKNNLENILDEVVLVWKDDESKESVLEYLNNVDDDLQFEYVKTDNTTKLILKGDYEMLTPGLNKVLKNPYEIKVSRVIYSE